MGSKRQNKCYMKYFDAFVKKLDMLPELIELDNEVES